MFIETALKNYLIEEVLNDAKSENLDVIFNKSITYYKSMSSGSEPYKKEYSKRMALKGKINSALIRDYDRKQAIVNHFFDQDKAIPIWAIFESLTLGEFGTFFACLNKGVKLQISHLLNLPSNLDSDGKLIQYIIFTIKDLRNAIAHNNVVFDTRFNTGTINSRLISCLSSEMGIPNITFTNIDDYVILTTYILRKMQLSKTEIRQFIRNFTNAIEALRNEIPINIYNQIINTNVRNKLQILDNYIKTH
jgi:abortive infection bacteriophage resistance protein